MPSKLSSRLPPLRSPWRRLLAWGVHIYTALGLVAAAGMAYLLAEPHPTTAAYRGVFLLMLVATLVDATDGTLARWIKVKEVLPGFDGRRLDDLTDFLTYTCLPLMLIWRADLLPPGQSAWLLLPLLASAYGFCQTTAKTADGFFRGFPSYWNVISFYLYVFHPPGVLSLTLILVFALLTFVPAKYLYPSQPGRLNALTNWAGALWTAFPVWILTHLPDDGSAAAVTTDETIQQAAYLSLFFPIYYLAASWIISVRSWLRRWAE